MAEVIGVKFRNTGKIYYFAPDDDRYVRGDGVIVETARGVEYGTVVLPPTLVEEEKVVMPLKEVIRKANDIKRVAEELKIGSLNAGITASIGIAIVPQDGTDYETVFKAADKALYYVKANGRNGFYYKDAEGIG